MYEAWLANPASVDESWQGYFSQLGEQGLNPTQLGPRPQPGSVTASPIMQRRPHRRPDRPGAAGRPRQTRPQKRQGRTRESRPGCRADGQHRSAKASIHAVQMIRAYRMIGHLEANLDPLGITPKTPQTTLDPKHYQFEGAALDAPVFVDGILGFSNTTPRQLLDKLRGIYCGRIGYEFMHINDAEQKTWLQRRIEDSGNAIGFTPEGKKAILNKLIEAEGFEKFSANRFVGTKRFGLDGAEPPFPRWNKSSSVAASWALPRWCSAWPIAAA